MFTKMRTILRSTWGHVHTSSITGLPKLSGAELARSSWAKRLESYTSVPDLYKAFFEPFLAHGHEFPYTVLTPSHERFIHRTSEKLICAFSSETFVLERNGNSFNALRYPFEGISYVEFRTALLASSLKICGLTSLGVHTSSVLMFNSVSDYLFNPILNALRRPETISIKVFENSEQERFDYLAMVNFKFMNFARHSLLEGEKVVISVLQPEIRMSLFTLLGNTHYKTISPTHMSILTEHELIVIREEATRRKEDRYGGIWDYIPLRNIKSLSLNEKDSNLLVLSIQLPNNIQFELLYQVAARNEVNQLINQFKEITIGDE